MQSTEKTDHRKILKDIRQEFLIDKDCVTEPSPEIQKSKKSPKKGAKSIPVPTYQSLKNNYLVSNHSSEIFQPQIRRDEKAIFSQIKDKNQQ